MVKRSERAAERDLKTIKAAHGESICVVFSAVFHVDVDMP